MTSRQSGDPAGEWLTVDEAAGRLGLSPSGLRRLAASEGFEVRRRGRRPGVRTVDVDAYLDRARIQPGEITAGRMSRGRYEAHEPFARRVDGDMPGLAEVMVLRDELGWTDADIGDALGLHFSNVSRRKVNGFRPDHVARMRQLIAEQLSPGHTADPAARRNHR